MNKLAFLLLAALPHLASADLVAAFSADGTDQDEQLRYNVRSVDMVSYADGVVGQAFDFRNKASSVQIVDHKALAFNGSFTISVWVYPRSLPGHFSPNAQIFFRGDDRNGNDPYTLCLRNDSMWHFALCGGEGAVVQAPAKINSWTHLVASYDSNLDRLQLYVNDELKSQSFAKIQLLQDLEATCNPGVSIGNVQRPQEGNHIQPFDGLIDELMVFNDARWVRSKSSQVPRRFGMAKWTKNPLEAFQKIGDNLVGLTVTDKIAD